MKRMFFNHRMVLSKIRSGEATMTTRLWPKALGVYRIVTGSRFRHHDEGIVIEIVERIELKLGKVSQAYHNEHGFFSPEEYLEAVNKVNRKKISLPTVVYVHRFRVLEKDDIK
jgi:hypothetical protein